MFRKLFVLLIMGLVNVFAIAGEHPKVDRNIYPASFFKNINNNILGASNAKVFGTDVGTNVKFTNPFSNTAVTYFAGTFRGELDGNAARFYCIDIQENIAYWTQSQPHLYTDSGFTPSQITYILNNYFPFRSLPYVGGLASQREAAAIQLAIWFFSDGVNVNTVQNETDIRTRALQIIADANANAGSVVPVTTLLITPPTQSVQIGSAASFFVSAFDSIGNSLSGRTISLSTTSGTLSAVSSTTGVNGSTGNLTLTKGTPNSATITATSSLIIPQGTRYVHRVDPNNYQKLVLATPTQASQSATSTVNWYQAPQPGICDLNGFATYTQGGWGSPSNSQPGKIRDNNFASVFPSGLTIGKNLRKATFTSASAIKNFLPQGGTASTLTGQTTNPTTTTAGVLAGQVTALTMNVFFDAAGIIGPNPQALGTLFIAQGPFYGLTVNQFLDIANSALAGETVAFTLSQINDAASSINENFNDGNSNGFLECRVQFGSIGDRVWEDKNNNGIQDLNENGVGGVTVRLFNCDNNLVATTTTNSNGIYTFTNLAPGDYYVEFVLPSGYSFTSRDQGSDNSRDSDANVSTGRTDCTTITSGENDLSWDAGIFKPTICVTNWTATVAADSAICLMTPQWITINARVNLTPNPSNAILQTSWRIVSPAQFDSGTTFRSVAISGDTSFTISAYWPGVRSGDSSVSVVFGINVLNCDGNPIRNAVTRTLFWNPTICPPPAPNNADVKVTKVVDRESVNNLEVVKFTIVATNLGPQNSTNVQVQDLLPAGLVFHSFTATIGSYNSTTGVWTIGNLNNGQSATLVITTTAQVNGGSSTTPTGSSFNLGVAQPYNLFVLYDLTQPSSDTEGKVAVGRNANLANYSVGDKILNAAFGQEDVLVVGNNLTYTSGAVYNGNVVYGNSTNLVPVYYPTSVTGGTIRQASLIDFVVAEAYLNNYSTTLAAQTVNGNTLYQWGGVFLTGTNPVLNVFSVDGAMLSVANDFQINVPNGASVVVNISGTTVSWRGGLSITGTSVSNVIYNFNQTTSLTIESIDVRGSILAPKADVNFITGVQHGQMIAKNLRGMGQFNLAQFTGFIPVDTTVVNVANIISSSPNDPVVNNNSSQAIVRVTNAQQQNNNNGAVWSNVGGVPSNESVQSINNDAQGNMIVGTVGGNIYRQSNNTLSQINSSMDVDFVWSLATANNGNIVAATEKGVFTSVDGSNWTNTGIFGIDVRSIVKTASGELFAATWGFGIYRSIDNGMSWSVANGGLTSMLITSVVQAPNGKLFAASFDGGVFRSDDNGNNWNKLNFEFEKVYSLGVTSNNIIIAGTFGDGVYRSVDNGSSWMKTAEGLTSDHIYSIQVDSRNNIFVNTYTGGIFESKNNGLNWTSAGLTRFGVSSMISNNSDNTFYVGTSSGSIMKRVDGTTSTKEEIDVPTEFELKQNYPNPFNPSTKIEFSVANKEAVSLIVYNILGQQVRTLINEELQAGKYSVTFDAQGLASGVYIYNLRSKSANYSKKMILQK
ncbi:MAG: hypothetical protein C0425_09495 [Chlorobiaceae bacterium]|nr:hypothetical protein [Chlorobiaceae bacterium]MBA4310555.1 hypothetical protein [Chlorobiaceae bacterium]